MPLDLALRFTLINSKYPCLENIFMVPKVLEPLKFSVVVNANYLAIVTVTAKSDIVSIVFVVLIFLCMTKKIKKCNDNNNFYHMTSLIFSG